MTTHFRVSLILHLDSTFHIVGTTSHPLHLPFHLVSRPLSEFAGNAGDYHCKTLTPPRTMASSLQPSYQSLAHRHNSTKALQLALHR